MVDVLMIDNDLGVAALNEHLLQLLDTAGILDGINLRTWNHTVADAGLRKLQGVLEYLHLVLYLLLVLGIVDALLYQIVQVHTGKLLVVLFLLHLDACQPEESS